MVKCELNCHAHTRNDITASHYFYLYRRGLEKTIITVMTARGQLSGKGKHESH